MPDANLTTCWWTPRELSAFARLDRICARSRARPAFKHWRDWRLQLRHHRAALDPESIPLLSSHIMASANDALEGWIISGHMLAFMQNLALDIAGRLEFLVGNEAVWRGRVVRLLL